MKELITEQREACLEADQIAAPVCPFSYEGFSSAVLEINDELVFPQYKRVFQQYLTNASGITELHLSYSDKEISFDEPELFAFGEQLIKQERFVAGTATEWGKDYSWTRIQELLENLVEEGILVHATNFQADTEVVHSGSRSSPLPSAKGTTERSWSECEQITDELTSHSIELGYLELVIPVFRVAHIALDAEGRQVGEANVFPKTLRLDIPTNWRACIHTGSRYQDEKPMNVTALKAMRRHWPQMMTLLKHIREAYLQRFPSVRNGWTVGDLERLSSLVLAMPAYLLMRQQESVKNGELHPVLSCMFRVTDGVRLTMHQMLFAPVQEPTLPPDATMTGPEIFAYAERNNSFFSEFGVCAGPKVMIEEFLQVFIEGESDNIETVQLDAEIKKSLMLMEEAIDYGFYGLQAHAIVFSLWPKMSRTSEQLWEILEQWTDVESEQLNMFKKCIQGYVKFLREETMLGTEEWRNSREVAYKDMYDQSAKGLGDKALKKSLKEHLESVNDTTYCEVAQQLRRLLCRRFYNKNEVDEYTAFENLIAVLMDFFCTEQAIVRSACEIQQQINHLLGRDSPTNPLQVSAFDVFNQLQDDVERLPFLGDQLEDALGLDIIITKDFIKISERIVSH